MKMNIHIHQGPVISATLDDTPTTRDFIRLLPLTLTLTDYNRTEKISDLPQKLTQEQAPSALTPKAGDIAYYAPWGNLAVFYRDFGRSAGLIRLGQLPTEALEAFSSKEPLTLTLEISP